MVLHHVAQHMNALQKKNTAAQIGSILAQVVLGRWPAPPSTTVRSTPSPAATRRNQPHRGAADEEGARIMAATGQFNPWGMVWFFQIMTRRTARSGFLAARSSARPGAHRRSHKRVPRHPDVFGKYKDTQQKDVAYW